MNFNKRLQQTIRDCGVSQYRIAKDLGISQSTLKNYREGKTKPNALILEQLSDYLNVSTSWLMTGKGEKNKNSNFVDIQKKEIRYYSTEALAGTNGIFNKIENSNTHVIKIPGFADCDIAINVWGDSMEPILKSGDIVICKKWQQNYIDFGNMYLVITKEMRMIKYLKKSQNKDKVTCASENKSYEPFEIDFSSILELYQVKGCLIRFAI